VTCQLGEKHVGFLVTLQIWDVPVATIILELAHLELETILVLIERVGNLGPMLDIEKMLI